MSNYTELTREFFSIRYLASGFIFLLPLSIMNYDILVNLQDLESLSIIFFGLVAASASTGLGVLFLNEWYLSWEKSKGISGKPENWRTFTKLLTEPDQFRHFFDSDPIFKEEEYILNTVTDVLNRYGKSKMEDIPDKIASYENRRWDLMALLGSCRSALNWGVTAAVFNAVFRLLSFAHFFSQIRYLALLVVVGIIFAGFSHRLFEGIEHVEKEWENIMTYNVNHALKNISLHVLKDKFPHDFYR